MILERNSHYFIDNKNEATRRVDDAIYKSSRKSLSASPPPPTKSEKVPRSPHFGRNLEEDHFGPMDLGDSSMHSESMLSKGLYGGSPNFSRNIPVYFGGSMHKKSVSSKGLYRGSPHFRRNIPVYFGGSMHNTSVSSNGLYGGSPHFGRNMEEDRFGPMDRGDSMHHSESVLSKGLYGGIEKQ
jgi:hypothetical protein